MKYIVVLDIWSVDLYSVCPSVLCFCISCVSYNWGMFEASSMAMCFEPRSTVSRTPDKEVKFECFNRARKRLISGSFSVILARPYAAGPRFIVRKHIPCQNYCNVQTV